jgi:hypothetical protein
MVNPTFQAGTRRPRPDRSSSAPAAGHAETHEKRAVHSGERTAVSRATGGREGQASVHLPQSMHRSGSLRIPKGLGRAARPILAPGRASIRKLRKLAGPDSCGDDLGHSKGE